MNPISFIPLRFWIYAGIAAAFAFLIWREHRSTARANQLAAQNTVLKGTIEIERENLRKANEATQRESKRQDALETERRNNPLPPVIVYRGPRVSTTCPGTAVIGEAAQADDTGENAGDSDAGIDISVKLDDFATDSESNLIQCEELIRWAATP